MLKAFSQSKNHASICCQNGVVSHGEQFSNVIRFPIILANTKRMTRHNSLNRRRIVLEEIMPNKPKVIFCSSFIESHQVLSYRLLNMLFSHRFFLGFLRNKNVLLWNLAKDKTLL